MKEMKTQQEENPPETATGEISLEETMRFELMRLQSFSSFPRNTAVFLTRLAKWGFYYTGNLTETRFFCCAASYKTWDANDNPEQIHLRISPHCPFMTGTDVRNVSVYRTCDRPSTSKKISSTADVIFTEQGNLSQDDTLNTAILDCRSNIQTQKTRRAFTQHEPYQRSNDDEQREETRIDFSHHGLYHSRNTDGQRNQSQLFFPQQTSDNPPSTHNVEGTLVFHRNTAPSVSGVPQRRPEPEITNFHTTRNINNRQNTYLYPEYSQKSQRVTSFSELQLLRQTPDEMAEAGFYDAGYGDCVRCFWCGIGLRNWEATDNPLVEHVLLAPDCSYALQSKGQDFIDIIRQVARISDSLQVETPVRRQHDNLINIKEARRQQQTIRFPLQNQATSRVAIEKLVNDYDNTVDRRHLIEENRWLREGIMCKMCKVNKVEVVFLPCSHLCCCAQCAPVYDYCPVCRQYIQGTVKTIIPN